MRYGYLSRVERENSARGGGGGRGGRGGRVRGGEVRQQEVERRAPGGDPRGDPLGALRARLPGREHVGDRPTRTGIEGDALRLVRGQAGTVRGAGRVAGGARRSRHRADPGTRRRRPRSGPVWLRAGAAALAA